MVGSGGKEADIATGRAYPCPTRLGEVVALSGSGSCTSASGNVLARVPPSSFSNVRRPHFTRQTGRGHWREGFVHVLLLLDGERRSSVNGEAQG